MDEWLSRLAAVPATNTLGLVKWCLDKSMGRAMERGYVDRNVVELCRTPRGAPVGRLNR